MRFASVDDALVQEVIWYGSSIIYLQVSKNRLIRHVVEWFNLHNMHAVSPGCTAARGYDLGKFEICDDLLDSPRLSKDEVVMLLVEKPDEGALGSVSFLTNVAQGF